MVSVELRNVHKKYGKVHALRGISLECKANEFLVVLGPSGAGKTSTLKMIAGLEPVTDGEIYLDGQFINTTPPGERGIAMVFETYALYPHLTVFENMAFPLKSKQARLSKDEISKSVRETADILQISQLLDRKPAELSGGQKQRVSLGRALVRKAGLLLMDEPISHLDAKLRHHMRRELKKYQTALNTTVIYVTHDYLEAMALADRIVVLQEGVIRQIGTPYDVYHHPSDSFVAALLGHPKINLISANVQKSNSNRIILAFDNESVEMKGKFFSGQKPDGLNKVTMGIRPQHVLINPAEAAPGINGEVYVNENLGVKNMVKVKMGEKLINVLTREPDYEIGQKVSLRFPEQHIMFFDESTGRNFSKQPAGNK